MSGVTESDDRGSGEVLLDVRPMLERGEEPFGKIMETVASLDGRSLTRILQPGS